MALEKPLKALISAIPKSFNGNSKIIKYLSNLNIDRINNINCQIKNGDSTLKFGGFDELKTPNKTIAQMIILEWMKLAINRQKIDINEDLKSILAQAHELQNSKIQKSEVIDELEKYLETDTLIYWDSEGSDLRLKQEKLWRVALDTFSRVLNLPRIRTTDSLFEIAQDEAITFAFNKFLSSLNNFQLAGFSQLVKATKSAIIPWGIYENIFESDNAADLALLELNHQADRWGNRREYHEFSKIILKKKIFLSKLFQHS